MGRYVGLVGINWILELGVWNFFTVYSQFGKAGAKIGFFWIAVLSEFLGPL